jgi:hypothetical protein
MKVRVILICLIPVFAALSCKNNKSAHPQSELMDQFPATGMNEKSIQAFSVALDKASGKMNKAYSLVYTIGDKSLYVERFSNSAGDQLYVERVKNDLENSVNKYYFKKDSLVLVSSTTIQNTEDGKVYKDIKTYLRNYVVFKKSARTATSAQAILVQPYLGVQDKTPQQDFHDNIQKLNDALQQQNEFEMVFDNISSYPDASFVMLKSKSPNGYKASVQLAQKDQFIDSLINYPATFKDEKLSFKWKVKNQDAIYVPKESTSTSASGLNK